MGATSGKHGSRIPETSLREAAVEVVRTLVQAGHVAHFAGGCVRDRLMGIEPTDYDVATDATPDRIASLFRRTHSVGESFGVMLVRIRSHVIEVATFRTDGQYSDGRHPDEVEFSDARHDARRRDFTINGLFEDPIEQRILDYVDGLADIEARLVRAIGDPHARLREDRLRMLRAVRFAARFGFTIESGTAEAIREGAGDLRGVSVERIGQEVKFMLSDRNRVVAAWELQYLGLDAAIFGGAACTSAPTRLGHLPDDAPYPTALAAWLLDRHAGEEQDPRRRAEAWARSLLLSNDERAGLLGALEVHLALQEDWPQLGVAAQKRLASSPWFPQGLLLLLAEDRQHFVDIRRQVEVLSRTGLAPPPLIDGNDLIGCGLEPGPRFKRLLDAVYDAQLEQAVSSREEALALARALGRAEADL